MERYRCFDRQLIERYDVVGPRYTSYPTAADFKSSYTDDDLKAEIEKGNANLEPLSIYVHIPFCESLCFYCGCSKIVTRNQSRADEYLDHLEKEIAHYSQLFSSQRIVDQLHWGGGTPTFLSNEQMSRLMNMLKRHFIFACDNEGEFSIEIDPRRVDPETIEHLRFIGFNRVSLGVQDFNLDVQTAINRIQPQEMTEDALQASRNAGFKSINFDLIYGLPKQKVEAFRLTLERVIELSPDRISLFNYAHMPHMIKGQRAINERDLPDANTKLDLLELSRGMLEEAGYISIGMDHFAKPSDELALALAKGVLHRNFQGYTTHKDHDMLGLGVTSISKIGRCYAQNHKTLDDYYQSINLAGHAVTRGISMDFNDRVRASVINDLSCERGVVFEDFKRHFNLDFHHFFTSEILRLQPFIEDNLVELSDHHLKVTEMGKILLRPICMLFDSYRNSDKTLRFSRVI